MSEKRILVTGVGGFLGSHVANALLEKGYGVRGTVRTQAKADKVLERYPSPPPLPFFFHVWVSRPFFFFFFG